MIAALSIGKYVFSTVSARSAVTKYLVPTRWVSDALATRKLFCAVRIASCALPTCTTLRSESEMLAAPALTLAVVVASCVLASSSWARAAASDSLAARNRLSDVRRPVVYDHGFAVYGTRSPCGPSRCPPLCDWPSEPVSEGRNWPNAVRTFVVAVRMLFSAMTAETLFSCASLTASAREIGWKALSPGDDTDGICCAANNAGAATNGINFLNMFSSAPFAARLRAVPDFPCCAGRTAPADPS